MNGLQRVNLTAMRLATLIWLAGIACCVPGMAAEPQQKEQTAAEKADRPRQQEISFQCIAPVPGLPVPMDLTQADGIRLNALDVTVSLKQHQAFLIYTCALDIPRGIRGKTISVGVPFQYEPPDEQANAARQEPIRSLPFTKAVQDVVTSVDDLKCDFSLVEGRHLQADAPSMFPIAGITHWLVAQVPNKAGIHVLAFQFSVPYTQDVAITPEPKVHMGEPRLTLLTSPVMTWTGGHPQGGGQCVQLGDDQPVRQAGSLCGCQIHCDDAQRRLYLVSAGSGRQALRSLLGAYSGPRLGAGQGWADYRPRRKRRFDGPVRCNGQLHPGQGPLWGSMFTGQPEKKFRLLGGKRFRGRPGGNPGNQAQETRPAAGNHAGDRHFPGDRPGKDSEARRHPNIAYSMFSRPKGIQVTLNGTYTFDATLRDDWTPQIVVPPYYRQPVHTIKIRINSIYRGTGTSDTYIGILKPIIQ